MRRSKGVSAVFVVIAIALGTVGVLAIVGYDSAQAAKATEVCKHRGAGGERQTSRCGATSRK